MKTPLNNALRVARANPPAPRGQILLLNKGRNLRTCLMPNAKACTSADGSNIWNCSLATGSRIWTAAQPSAMPSRAWFPRFELPLNHTGIAQYLNLSLDAVEALVRVNNFQALGGEEAQHRI